VRIAAVWGLLSLLVSCAAPAAFPVPEGPPKRVALDVELPVDVLGTWTTSGFTETLRLELAKYNIAVVDRSQLPDATVLVDLGRWTYRSWQEIDVALDDDGKAETLGRIRVPDLSTTTTDVAAQIVATLIARRLWAREQPRKQP
jgi:hypothetical protein